MGSQSSAVAPPRGVFHDLKRLGRGSAVYALGRFLNAGITFAMLPLYMRILTKADYGIIALAVTIATVLGAILPLGVHGALSRHYFTAKEEEERKTMVGTAWTFITLHALVLCLLLDSQGDRICQLAFKDFTYSPYIRMSVWTAFAATFGLIPLNLLQLEEKPREFSVCNLVVTLVTQGLVLAGVLYYRNGYGYLLGTMLAPYALFPLYLGLSWSRMTLRPRMDLLKPLLALGLSIVPHALAAWVLEMSDRVVLERNVPLGQLGIYSFGYQMASALMILGQALNSAWVPYFFKMFEQEKGGEPTNLRQLCTYYVAAVWCLGLPLIAGIRELIVLIAPPSFQPAYEVSMVVMGGYLLSTLYFVPGNFLLTRTRTAWLLPLATGISAAVNLVLNLWYVPRYGILAAAWSTAAAYAVTCLVTWGFALRFTPYPLELRRIATLGLVGLSLTAGMLAAARLGGWSATLLKLVLMAAFPALLWGGGFFKAGELLAFRQGIARLTRKAAAP